MHCGGCGFENRDGVRFCEVTAEELIPKARLAAPRDGEDRLDEAHVIDGLAQE
jgi:hypothetical protein